MKDLSTNQGNYKEVLLINEKGQKLGKINIDQARFLAFEHDLDLMEVSSNANPPVCKLMDYKKVLYQKNKQTQKQKSKQKNSEIKEIKLSINIGQHDLEVKADRSREFFQQGHKVKVFIILRGREKLFADKAFEIINRFCQLCQGTFESPVKKNQNIVLSIIKPSK